MDTKELNNLINRITLTGPGGVDKIKKVLKEIIESGGDVTEEELQEALAEKQDTLVSGNNIKTINGQTVLGGGDITIPKGDTGPQGPAGPQGPEGPQGNQGNTGSSVDYPYELVNNRTTNDATKGLSAAEGYRIGQDISQLEAKVDVLEDKTDTTIVHSRNLADYAEEMSGLYVNSSGKIASLAGTTSVKFPCEPSTQYTISKLAGTHFRVAYFNTNPVAETQGAGTISDMYATHITITTAADSQYIVAYIHNSDETTTKEQILASLQIELGAEATSYVVPEWDAIDKKARADIDVLETAVEEIPILSEKLDWKVDIYPAKNLYNPATNTNGKYIKPTGDLDNNASIGVSDYIPVSPGTYYISGENDVTIGSNAACFNLYDSTKSRVSTVTGLTKSLTIQSGIAFIRISVYLNVLEVQVERGEERTTYEAYNPIGGYPSRIADGSVSYNKLNQSLKDRIDGAYNPKFKGFTATDTLAPGDDVKTAIVQLDKDSMLSALIDGTIQTVQVGVGKQDPGYGYFAHWIELSQSEAKLYYYDGASNVLLATYSHGLTLTDKTTVVVESKMVGNTRTTKLEIFNGTGDMFEQSLQDWGVGPGFVYNGNTSGSLDVEVRLMPRQITKKIWLFGDSYVSFNYINRWPYYFAKDGLLDYFANNKPGLTPSVAYTALQNLLQLGFIPSFLVWTLGMNGNPTETKVDGEYVINTDQKAVIDNVVNICQQYGITPVFGTVPTVPTRQMTGFSKYIRNLGYRYIDFALAVGADEEGNWTTGLLSNDGVHPSIAGAKVLASRVFIDFPELSIIE